MILLLAIVFFFVFDISGGWAVLYFAVAVTAEAGELLFLRHWSHRMAKDRPAKSPDEQLVGLIGEVVSPCRPSGQVRVRGELWAATCAAGADPGARVRVESVDELTIVVAPAA
jgi:membrane protein implicated in regulation of membrane protease activity